MISTLPHKAEWFAALEKAVGLLARYPWLREAARGDTLSAAPFRHRRTR
jgi:hypothetical protein